MDKGNHFSQCPIIHQWPCSDVNLFSTSTVEHQESRSLIFWHQYEIICKNSSTHRFLFHQVFSSLFKNTFTKRTTDVLFFFFLAVDWLLQELVSPGDRFIKQKDQRKHQSEGEMCPNVKSSVGIKHFLETSYVRKDALIIELISFSTSLGLFWSPEIINH